MSNEYFIKTNYYKQIEEYAIYLQKRIALLEKQQRNLPNATIKCLRRGNSISFYKRVPGKKHKVQYIRRSNMDEIRKIANATYIKRVLPKLKTNLNAAKKFLNFHSGVDESIIAIAMPEYLQALNSNLFLYKPLYLKTWQSHPYTRNPYKPEGLIHDTARGEKVRSKSEVLIADCLFEYKLAYKPESPLRLKKSNKTIYPDFTIIHPESLKEIYWEHFGMMDNPEYAREATAKINALSQEGLFIGENLICTFETSDLPLTRGTIETYIKKYFLTTTL